MSLQATSAPGFLTFDSGPQLRVTCPHEARRLAWAAATDAANRQMRRDGRSAWTEADHTLACETFHRLHGAILEAAGFGRAD